MEPIEETGDNADDNDDMRHFKEFCEINNVKKSNILQGNFDQNDIADNAGDEIIYENAYGLEQKKLMGIPLRNQKLLSEIGEIPEEESSLKDSIRLETITNRMGADADVKTIGNRFSTKMSAQALSQNHSRANSQLIKEDLM